MSEVLPSFYTLNLRYFSVSTAPIKNYFSISATPIVTKIKKIKQNYVSYIIILLRYYGITLFTLLPYWRYYDIHVLRNKDLRIHVKPYYVTITFTRWTSRLAIFGAVGSARLKFLAQYRSFLTGDALTEKYQDGKW